MNIHTYIILHYIHIYIYIYILCVCVCVCVCVLYRLQIVDTSPLRIRVKNDDVSMGGDVIGQITFPMEQIAMSGFGQKASGFSLFRLSRRQVALVCLG
jgi:hypothetical protein